MFKDKEIVDTVDLNANSCWLVGRDRAVADLPVDHPSCSKQHAVLQFRYVVKTGEFGDKESGVKPYVMDLESANGTTVGKVEVPGGRYLELKEGDLIMFGLSTRWVFTPRVNFLIFLLLRTVEIYVEMLTITDIGSIFLCLTRTSGVEADERWVCN